jgi:predicted transcriptional regulator of viral defense system
MPGKTYSRLVNLAGENHGFVTPDDARDLGINPLNLVRMAERGQLERRRRGVYRFPLIPPSPLDSYAEAALWPQGGGGVLSHETALALYDLSDVHPRQIHVTLPRGRRVRRAVPISYRLHHEDLAPNQVTRHEGIPIVTPAHAIRQAHRARMGAALLAQAVDDGERNGRLPAAEARQLREEIGVRNSDGVRR